MCFHAFSLLLVLITVNYSNKLLLLVRYGQRNNKIKSAFGKRNCLLLVMDKPEAL